MIDDSLARFLDELAADPPGPAAGSAAAVVVAMAAALLELAARRSGESEASTRASALRTAAAVEELASPLVERAKPALRGEVVAAVELARAARTVSERLISLNVAGKD
ncbi:MAG: cyclodeaminase/cyclohydrolase family protein [Chloroflexi bacterium]|nr:cyclodeaminase/cyclohydrolase family protein [Chloroflexota bacterium]